MEVLTTRQVAEQLQLRPSTVADYARRGILPSFTIGRHVRFKAVDLEEWLEQQGPRGAGA